MDRYYKIAKDSETGKKFAELVSRLDDFTAIYNKFIEKYEIKGCFTDNTYIARVLCVNFKDGVSINKDDWKESPLKGAYIPKNDSNNKELIETWNLLKAKSLSRSEIHKLLRARKPFVFCGFSLGMEGNFFIVTSNPNDFDFPSDVIEISNLEYLELTKQK